MEGIFTQVNGALSIQITAQLGKVKGRFVHAPGIGSPLCHVMHHI